MIKKITWITINCLLILLLFVASCNGSVDKKDATEEDEIVEEGVKIEEVYTDQEQEEVHEEEIDEIDSGEPQYGGTFVYRVAQDPLSFDPYRTFLTGQHWIGCGISSLVYEPLSLKNWQVDRETVFDFKANLMPPETWGPGLAESWEFPDGKTIIWHIQKGIYFHDRSPVNGRELTATDVKYSYDRIQGTGSGFTSKSPYIGPILDHLESTEVIDGSTVVFNLKVESFQGTHEFFTGMLGTTIVPREAVEEFGSLDAWMDAIGTGPFIPESIVVGSSVTAERNPNYWGYDRYIPANKIPYLDNVRFLVISDKSTTLSGLRTHKIDLVENLTWEDMEQLKKTNPELVAGEGAANGNGVGINLNVSPFNDVRVRRAMELAVDKEEIAQTHYGGYGDPTPHGPVGYQMGHYVPYDEWPQEIKQYFGYDPEEAKQLLNEAGYPDGFSCSLTISTTGDIDIAQILMAYLGEIGIDMSLNILEPGAFESYRLGGNTELCWGIVGSNSTEPPPRFLEHATSYHPWGAVFGADKIADKTYDELFWKAQNAKTIDEMMEWDKKCDMYQIENAYALRMPLVPSFNISQPYLNRYNGEMGFQFGHLVSHLWINKTIKSLY